MMFAVTVLAACSNDEQPAGGMDEGNGEDTWAAFSIQLPKTTASRSGADDGRNDTEVETKVKNVALYVEQNGHLYTSGVLSITDFADFDGAGSVFNAKIAIKAQAGEANVWAVVNPTDKMHTRIMELPANEAFHTAFEPLSYEMSGGYLHTQVQEPNGGFVMANKKTEGVTLKAGVNTEDEAVNGSKPDPEKNHFEIEVERAVAKVAVTSLEENLDDLNALKEQGDFSDIRFYVAQINKETFMARKTDRDIQSNGAGIITPGNDHEGKGDFGTDVEIKDALLINTPSTSMKDLNSFYMLENSMLKPLEQNATHAVIVATWTPKKLYAADGKTEFTGYSTGDDFWFYDSKYYGELPQELENEDITVQDKYKWSEGKCYYRVYLYDKYNDRKCYEVVRNTLYNVNINSIKAPGENNPDVPVGPTPIPEDVWVTATIEILDWTMAQMDDVDLVR